MDPNFKGISQIQTSFADSLNYGIPWLVPLKWKKGPSKAHREETAAFQNVLLKRGMLIAQWIQAAIDKALGKETGEKTFLNAMLAASDSDTGAGLTRQQTIISSTGFMYFLVRH
jgi:hypothetical protein